MTKQRAVILNVIRKECLRHMTAEEIFELARCELPTISRATVYNNLHSMENEGLVRKIGGIEAADRYDFNIRPHAHLFCESCKGIFDIILPNLESEIEKAGKIKLTEYELKLSGICKECLSK